MTSPSSKASAALWSDDRCRRCTNRATVSINRPARLRPGPRGAVDPGARSRRRPRHRRATADEALAVRYDGDTSADRRGYPPRHRHARHSRGSRRQRPHPLRRCPLTASVREAAETAREFDPDHSPARYAATAQRGADADRVRRRHRHRGVHQCRPRTQRHDSGRRLRLRRRHPRARRAGPPRRALSRAVRGSAAAAVLRAAQRHRHRARSAGWTLRTQIARVSSDARSRRVQHRTRWCGACSGCCCSSPCW